MVLGEIRYNEKGEPVINVCDLIGYTIIGTTIITSVGFVIFQWLTN